MKKILLLFCIFFTKNLYSQIIIFPDLGFKSALISHYQYDNWGIWVTKDVNGDVIFVDQNEDGEIDVSEALLVYEIDFSNPPQSGTWTPGDFYDMTDFTGIEYFTNLKRFSIGYLHYQNDNSGLLRPSCDTKPIYLDLSKNINLEVIAIHMSSIVSITLGNNTNLKGLYLEKTCISAVDVSGTPNLTNLTLQNLTRGVYVRSINSDRQFCNKNDIGLVTSLDITNLIDLEYLDCGCNQITDIDLSKNTKLDRIYLDYNKLTSLDLQNNKALQILHVNNNALNSLIIKNEITESVLVFDKNPNLTNICADSNDVSFVQNLLTQYNYNTNIVTSNCLIGVDEFKVFDIVKVYPNPIKEELFIESSSFIRNVTVFDITGRIVFKQSALKKKRIIKLHISNLNIGLYNIKITTDKGIMTQKIMKE